jgi:hypothetical protein
MATGRTCSAGRTRTYNQWINSPATPSVHSEWVLCGAVLPTNSDRSCWLVSSCPGTYGYTNGYTSPSSLAPLGCRRNGRREMTQPSQPAGRPNVASGQALPLHGLHFPASDSATDGAEGWDGLLAPSKKICQTCPCGRPCSWSTTTPISESSPGSSSKPRASTWPDRQRPGRGVTETARLSFD